MLRRVLYITVVFILIPINLFAAEAPGADSITFQKARVTAVTAEGAVPILGTDAIAEVQTLTAEILDGPESGRRVTFENDYV
jgi:hypothetical protein